MTSTTKLKTLQENGSLMLASGEYSDMIISCDTHQFKVHKAVVCVRSPLLKTAMQGNYKVRLPVSS